MTDIASTLMIVMYSLPCLPLPLLFAHMPASYFLRMTPTLAFPRPCDRHALLLDPRCPSPS